jgi:chromosome segregation ATPase
LKIKVTKASIDYVYILGVRIEAEGLKYVIDNRKTARRKKKDLETKEVELKAVSDQIEQYMTEINEMEDKLRALKEMEKEYSAMESKVSEVSGKLQMLEKQVGEMKKNIRDQFDGDIADLQQHMKKFEQEHKKQDEKLRNVRGLENDRWV